LEKLKPTHDLEAFKAAFAKHRSVTKTALLSARRLGYERQDLAKALSKLTRQQFQKSMTSYENHRQWQDVYHLEVDGSLIYVKFTDHVVTEFILLSFKRT
jgi:motility quorum-sensing regulator/GCU-specific mRNA interferase toxin